MKFCPLAFGVLLGAASAAFAAAAPPPFIPQRSVALTYTLAAPGRSNATYLFSFDAGNQRARVEDPGTGTYFIVDLSNGQAAAVVPSLHSVIEAPNLSEITREITDASGASFTPLGTDVIAGVACQDYAVQDSEGAARACLTPDGVILHFSGHDAHGSAEVTASTVSYGAQPGHAFLPPDGYNHITLPPGALEAFLSQQ